MNFEVCMTGIKPTSFWSLFDSEHLIQLATFPKTSYKLLCNLNLFSIYCEIFGLEKLHQLSGEVGFWKILNIKSNFKRVNNKIDWNMYIWRRNKLNPEKKMYWWKLLIELHSHWNSLTFVQKPTKAADSIIATVSLIPGGGNINPNNQQITMFNQISIFLKTYVRLACISPSAYKHLNKTEWKKK